MKANKIVFTIIILLLIDFILTGCAPPVPEVIEVTGVSIIEDDQSINIGDTLQLTAVVTPEDADNKAVTWESDNTDVAAVDENGLVTALKKGIANITVITEDSAFTDTIKITVTEPACGGVTPGTDPPTINSFTADSYHIISGESVTLSWNVTGADSVTINQGIGTVDSTGTKVVNPTATITYTLTASNTNGSVTNTVTVNVGSALGSIDINSNPAGAKVYLDGIDTGHITPIVLTNVAAGTHTVKLELLNYQNREDTDVTVTAGETTYINWALTYAPAETLTLQPGSEGKDAVITDIFPNMNYGVDTALGVVVDPCIKIERTYLEFDLSSVSLPPGAVIIHGDLRLYQSSGLESFSIGAYQVTSEWQENTITWNNRPSSLPEAEAFHTVSPASGAWRTWDIDDLVQGWIDGSIANHGILLKAADESTNEKIAEFRSSEYVYDATKRPKLVISYYVP